MKKLLKLALLSLSFSTATFAQEAADLPVQEEYVTPTFDEIKEVYPSAMPAGKVGDIKRIATIKVTENHYFLNGSDTNNLLVEWGNLPSSYAGSIVDKDFTYVITFNFEDTGYIKDEDKDDLDADELMEAFREGNAEGNKERKKRGLQTFEISGWSQKPEYVESTNRVIWGITIESADGISSINHEIRLLGRKGVMSATIICDPAQISTVIPTVDSMLEGFEFNDGEKYSQFEEGDKVSEYGLKALIVGGGIFAASKLGLFALLAKFWKAIVGGIVVIGVGIKKFFTRSN